jgi:hypothetical protein
LCPKKQLDKIPKPTLRGRHTKRNSSMVTVANVQEMDCIAATAQPRALALVFWTSFVIQAKVVPVRIAVAMTKTANTTPFGIKLSACLAAAEKFLADVSVIYFCQ